MRRASSLDCSCASDLDSSASASSASASSASAASSSITASERELLSSRLLFSGSVSSVANDLWLGGRERLEGSGLPPPARFEAVPDERFFFFRVFTLTPPCVETCPSGGSFSSLTSGRSLEPVSGFSRADWLLLDWLLPPVSEARAGRICIKN